MFDEKSVPLTVKVPETTRLSSIVVVPPAESIVRFPVDVSISLLPVTPIRILSIVAPPTLTNAPIWLIDPVIFAPPTLTNTPVWLIDPVTPNPPVMVVSPVTPNPPHFHVS